MNYRFSFLPTYKFPFIILTLVILFLASGCTNTKGNVNQENISFAKNDENYYLENTSQIESYAKLESDLDNLGIEYNKDTSVAAASTSTANILYELGMNLCAVPQSSDLTSGLQKEVDNGSIKSIGSAMEPNQEVLVKENPDIIFISSAMPMQEEYVAFDNLVSLPQDKYIDIFVDVELLTKYFTLNKGQEIFNTLVDTHLKAKEIEEENPKQVDAVLLEHAYGKLSIATDDSYIGSLAKQLDINNIYGEYSDVDLDLSKEKILVDNPSTIIIYTKDDEGYEKMQVEYENIDDELKQLDAYKNNQIYILNSISLNVDMNSPQTLLELSEKVYR